MSDPQCFPTTAGDSTDSHLIATRQTPSSVYPSPIPIVNTAEGTQTETVLGNLQLSNQADDQNQNETDHATLEVHRHHRGGPQNPLVSHNFPGSPQDLSGNCSVQIQEKPNKEVIESEEQPLLRHRPRGLRGPVVPDSNLPAGTCITDQYLIGSPTTPLLPHAHRPTSTISHTHLPTPPTNPTVSQKMWGALSQFFSSPLRREHTPQKEYRETSEKTDERPPVREDFSAIIPLTTLVRGDEATATKQPRQTSSRTAPASPPATAVPPTTLMHGEGAIAIEQQGKFMKARLTGITLGEGSYGRVEEVEINDEVFAAKTFKAVSSNCSRFWEKFGKEITILIGLKHSNIVQCYGICVTEDAPIEPRLVMERLETDLHAYLVDGCNTHLPLHVKIHILHGVASGLAYLHRDPPVVHRDLTARNVLLRVGSPLVVKIADFGNARIVQIESGELMTMTTLPGTLVYMPPEAFNKKCRYNKKLDIFSFGHLALFTVIQVFPSDLLVATFYDKDSGSVFGRSETARRQKYFLSVYDLLGEDHALVALITRCLHNDPNSRPSAEELLCQLEELKRETSVDVPPSKSPAVIRVGHGPSPAKSVTLSRKRPGTVATAVTVHPTTLTGGEGDNAIGREVQTKPEESATAAFGAFRKCCAALRKSIGDAEDLAWELYSADVIAEDIVDRMSLPGLTPREKNSVLLSAVRDQIAVDPSKFHKVLKIFKENKAMAEITKRLETTYRELINK